RLLDRFYRLPSNDRRQSGAIPKRFDDKLASQRTSSSLEIQPARPETFERVFVGGHIGGVIPVPIPNTVVKPAKPMILLQRESRSLPALNRTPGPKGRGFFFARGLRA